MKTMINLCYLRLRACGQAAHPRLRLLWSLLVFSPVVPRSRNRIGFRPASAHADPIVTTTDHHDTGVASAAVIVGKRLCDEPGARREHRRRDPSSARIAAEVVLAQPSSQHVWIAGYWTWRNDRYEWMAGHWALPRARVQCGWRRVGAARQCYRFLRGLLQ